MAPRPSPAQPHPARSWAPHCMLPPTMDATLHMAPRDTPLDYIARSVLDCQCAAGCCSETKTLHTSTLVCPRSPPPRGRRVPGPSLDAPDAVVHGLEAVSRGCLGSTVTGIQWPAPFHTRVVWRTLVACHLQRGVGLQDWGLGFTLGSPASCRGV